MIQKIKYLCKILFYWQENMVNNIILIKMKSKLMNLLNKQCMNVVKYKNYLLLHPQFLHHLKSHKLF